MISVLNMCFSIVVDYAIKFNYNRSSQKPIIFCVTRQMLSPCLLDKGRGEGNLYRVCIYKRLQ